MLRSVWVLVLALATPLSARDLIKPAELPPPGYAGQQYVDSKGCLFMRAGTKANVTWLPRVTRKGVPLCGNPPSGRRVPVAEEGASLAVPVPSEVTAPPASDGDSAPAATGQYYVAVGSFGVAANADKASARLKSLNYPVARGNLDGNGALTTVFAGPFDTAESAALAVAELRDIGFPDAMVMRP